MELWKLLVAMIVCMAGVVLLLVQFADMYGGDWDYISSSVAGAILMITVMAVIVVVVKHGR